jgi:hypothetical protein
MKSIHSARILVVADEVSGDALVHRLLRLGLSSVLRVGDLAAARRMCEAGGVDACLVILPCFLLEEVAAAVLTAEAPGRNSGTPSLLLADVVTPYVRKAAQTSGHVGVVVQNISPRLIYRRIAGVLQQAWRARAGSQQRQAHKRMPRATRPTGRGLLRGPVDELAALDVRKLKLQ